MYQLHDLSKSKSMIDFRFEDFEALKIKAKSIIKNKEKYHIIILDTKTDRVIFEKQKWAIMWKYVKDFKIFDNFKSIIYN